LVSADARLALISSFSLLLAAIACESSLLSAH
jgi:hypothetical protein